MLLFCSVAALRIAVEILFEARKKDGSGKPGRRQRPNHLNKLKSIGKLIVPSEAEIKSNNRARSAKLRIAEKK